MRRLPFTPPLAPMLSRAADALPDGDGWQFERKWDGFPTIVFRDGDEVWLQSRDEQPMNRYFPELLAPLASALPARCVVNGEILYRHGAERLHLDEALGERQRLGRDHDRARIGDLLHPRREVRGLAHGRV